MTCRDQELHKILPVSEANLEPKMLPCLYLFPSVGIQSRKIWEKLEGERLKGGKKPAKYVGEGMGLRVEKTQDEQERNWAKTPSKCTLDFVG